MVGTASNTADLAASSADDPRAADEIWTRPLSATISFFEVSIRFE